MRSNNFKEAKVSLYIVAVFIACCIIFYLFASLFISMGYEGFHNAKNANANIDYNDAIIVIDPGHGGEDPGASDNGLIEKNLNLEIAKLLSEYLSICGFDTVLTRNDDVLLYDPLDNQSKKRQDLNNRVKIAESYDDSIFVSIHINKFPAEYCNGLQTFYSANNAKSKILAESIQNSAMLLQPNNKRVIKDGTDAIYVLENLNLPSVLIECGFISNNDEAKLLTDKEYKQALAFSIYCGIAETLENNQ